MDKSTVHQGLLKELDSKINELQNDLIDIKTSLSSDTKSTAGDKHETGRAMAHREQEQLSTQLDQIIQLKRRASSINPKEEHDTVKYGSLVKTSQGLFFFSVGLGKIIIDATEVFCISATTPLGNILLEKKAGDTAVFNNGTIKVITVE